MEVLALNKQTLLDLAVQLSGDADFIFELLKSNPELNLTSDLTSGQKISFESKKNATGKYLQNFNIATGIKDLSQKDWILDTGKWNDQAYWIDTRTWIDSYPY